MEFVLENGEKIVMEKPVRAGGFGVSKFADFQAKIAGLEVGKAFVATKELIYKEPKPGMTPEAEFKANLDHVKYHANKYVKNKLHTQAGMEGFKIAIGLNGEKIVIGREA